MTTFLVIAGIAIALYLCGKVFMFFVKYGDPDAGVAMSRKERRAMKGQTRALNEQTRQLNEDTRRKAAGE